MPDLTANSPVSQTPPILDYKIVGTAAGTTTIKSQPSFFGGIVFPTRVASGVITIYDHVS